MRRTLRPPTAIVLAMIAALIAISAAPAGAYSTFAGHKLTYGINKQSYWMDSTAVAAHPNAIPNGVGLWSATTDTKVYYTRTSSKSASRLDFYRRSSESGRYCAVTEMFVDTKSVDPTKQNWWWAKVTIDPSLGRPSACGPDEHRKGIVAHEMGHAMGLAHTKNISTLMYVDIASTYINAPTKDDRNGINALY